MQRFAQILKDAALLWYEKDADHMSSTVSYYAIFAMTPLLLLSVTIISLLYGKELVVSTLLDWGAVLGDDAVSLLYTSVQNLETVSDGYAIPLVGILFFSWMIIVLLNTFTAGLHHLWGLPHRGVRGWAWKTVHSLLFVVVLEVYLLFLFGLNTIVEYMVGMSGLMIFVVIKPVFSIIATAVMFSLAYRILPWEAPPAKARLIGGFVASVLFTIAKFLVAFYITTTPTPDLFGAAGIVIVLLIWLYVTSAIMYFGATIAHVVAKNSGVLATK